MNEITKQYSYEILQALKNITNCYDCPLCDICDNERVDICEMLEDNCKGDNV